MRLDVMLVSASVKYLTVYLSAPHTNSYKSTTQMVVQNVSVIVLMLTVMLNVVEKDLVLLSR